MHDVSLHEVVAYASKYGSTKAVTERVAVFNQRWLSEGEEFVQRNVEVLAGCLGENRDWLDIDGYADGIGHALRYAAK
jgi:hypothetical protein